MKTHLLLGISLCFFFIAAQAQSAHTVDFNSYVSTSSNDLTNNFTGGFALATNDKWYNWWFFTASTKINV